MSRTTRLLFTVMSVLLLGTLGTACKKKGQSQDASQEAASTSVQSTAQVRVVHGADAGAISITTDGVEVASGLNQNAYAREHTPFPAGGTNVAVTANGNQIASTNLNLNSGKTYTVVVLGNAQSGYTVAALEDNLSGAGGKNRFANGLPSAGSVSFVANGGATLASGIAYGKASSFVSVPSDFQRVTVKSGANNVGSDAVPNNAQRAVTTIVVPKASGAHFINIVDRPN